MTHQSRTSSLTLAVMLTLSLIGDDPNPPVNSFPGSVPVEILLTDPLVTVRDATRQQLARLGGAFDAFESAGLELPALEISFAEEATFCDQAHGWFIASEDSMRIRICAKGLDWVYEHELAHAWERANVSNEQRRAFLDLRGLAEWRDHAAAWNERGVEWAAVVIQQGLTGLPLPPALSAEMVSRLEGFEMLTGRAAPILIAWVAARDVPCGDRPTAASRSVADANGLTCEGNRSVRVSRDGAPQDSHRPVRRYGPGPCQPLLSSPMDRG